MKVNLAYYIQQGLIYGASLTGYLLLVMMTTDPITWGYSDYPERVKRKVREPSSDERRIGLIVAVPFILFTLLFPVY